VSEKGGQRGLGLLLDFEIISKKGCFSISKSKNQISPLLAPPEKNYSDAHAQTRVTLSCLLPLQLDLNTFSAIG